MTIPIFDNGKEYISASRAAEKVGYTSDYIGQLCRSGKIPGRLVGRAWHVDLDALLEHRGTKQTAGRGEKAAPKVFKVLTTPLRQSVDDDLSLVEATQGGFKYGAHKGELLPVLSKVSVVAEKKSPRTLKASEYALTVAGLLFMITSSFFVLEQMVPEFAKNVERGMGQASSWSSNLALELAGEASDLQLASASFSGVISESLSFLKSLFTKDEPELSLLPAYRPPDGEEKSQSVISEPLPGNADWLRDELKSELYSYIDQRLAPQTLPIAPSPGASSSIVYNYTYNPTILREEILLADTRPAISIQSDRDTSRVSNSITNILDGGDFINASITNSTGSFSSLSGTLFTFTNATGTSLYLSGNAEIDGSLDVGGNTVTLGQLISTRVPTLAHVFTPSWPSGTSNASDATIYINPASATPDTNIFAAAVGGAVKFLVDAEGDVYANNLILAGSTSAGETNIAGNLTVQDSSTLGDAPSDTITLNGQLLALASTTLQNFTFSNATGTSATTTNLFSTSGMFTRSTSTDLYASTLTASTLYSNTANLTESTNLFYTDARVNSYIHASTTIPKIYTDNTFGGTQTFSNTITGSISGNAGTVTNGVYTTTFDGLFDTRLSATTTLPNLTTLLGLTDITATRAIFTNATTTSLFSTTASSTNLFASLASIGGSAFNVIANGNVGIGTTNPGSKLSVAGTINVVDGSGNAIISAGTNGAFRVGLAGVMGGTIQIEGGPKLRNDLSGFGVINAGESAYANIHVAGLAVGSYAAAGVTIPSNGAIISGNVGIGTTNPGYALQVYKNTTGEVASDVTNASATGYAQITVRNDVAQGIGGLQALGSGTAYGGMSLANSVNLFASTGISNGFGIIAQHATAPIRLGTQSTERMRIDHLGNVGIGTTNPTEKLEVSGNLIVTGNSTTTNATTTNFFSTTASSTNLFSSLLSVGGSALNVIANGNVGIGTTNPVLGTKLDVSGGNIRIENGSNDSSLLFKNAVSSNTPYLTYRVADGRFGFVNTDGVENLTILNGGNVGIGTTNPSEKLHVAGNIRLSGDFYAQDGSATAPSIRFYNSASGLYNDADNLGFSVGGSSRMYISATSGNVGIGTANPGAKLHVRHSVAGETAEIMIQNTETANAASHARLRIITGGASAGDAKFLFDTQASTVWNVGVDNSDSDKFIFSNNSTGALETSPILAMQTNGNVGIGATSPGYKLSVHADTATNYNSLYVQGGGNSTGAYIAYFSNHSGASAMLTLRGDGFPWINQAWSVGSDRRLKENIVYLDGDGLSKILALKPVSFDYISGGQDNIGFIAQEVQEVIPEAVTVGDPETGMLSLKSDFIVPYLVNAIKELYAEFNELKNTVLAFADHFFSKEVETELLCVSDTGGERTCITKTQLDSLLANAGQTTSSTSFGQPTADNSQPTTSTSTTTVDTSTTDTTTTDTSTTDTSTTDTTTEESPPSEEAVSEPAAEPTTTNDPQPTTAEPESSSTTP